jgi:hypothetical protein
LCTRPIALSQVYFVEQSSFKNGVHGEFRGGGGVTASLHRCWCKRSAESSATMLSVAEMS